jgi:cyanophycin synthetase
MHAAASAVQGATDGMSIETDPASALRKGLALCQPGDVLFYSCGNSVNELVDAIRPVDPVSAERICETLA